MRRWTRAEEELILRHAARGAAYCAQRLKRTEHAVRCKARRLGVLFREEGLPGHVTLVEVVALSGRRYADVWDAAHRAGMIASRRFVPKRWAEAYIIRAREADDVASGGWVTLGQVARELGMTADRLRMALHRARRSGQGRYAWLASRARRSRRTAQVFNPWDVRVALTERLDEAPRRST